MRMKTFLLGSAAALGFGGAAQAADLSVVSYAEPVDYVRVCDAFGAGYYYIPGTDTCLRIGGYVRFQVYMGEDTADHDRDYYFRGRSSVDITASSMTDLGVLTAWTEFEANWDGQSADGLAPSWSNPESAGVSFGPFSFGTGDSMFAVGNDSYTAAFHLDDDLGTGMTDGKAAYAQVGWNVAGFSVTFRAESQDVRAVASDDDHTGVWYSSSSQGDIPDLLLQLGGEWGNVNAKVTFLYADTNPNSTWGVSGAVEATDLINGMDRFRLAAEYVDLGANGGSGCKVVFGPGCTQGDGWGVQGSFEHFFSSDLSLPVTVQYVDWSGISGVDGWSAAAALEFRPVEDLQLKVEGAYWDYNDSWNAVFEVRRDFGG